MKPWENEVKVLEGAAEGGLSERQFMGGYPGGAIYYADASDDVPTQSSKLQKVRSYLETEKTKIVSEYRKSCRDGFLYLGLLPPLLLLALGAAIGWALAGFQRKSPPP